jgi:hypothetical protein
MGGCWWWSTGGWRCSNRIWLLVRGWGVNKKCPHILVGTEVFHTSVVVGVVDYGVWWHLLVRLLSETSQVCLDQMVQVWEDQEVLYISILTVRK